MAVGALLSSHSATLRSTITAGFHNVGDQVRSTSNSIFPHGKTSRHTCLWCEGHYKRRKECKRHATGHFINYLCPISGCDHTATRRDRFAEHLDKQHLGDKQRSHLGPTSAILLSASFAVNNWKALGCGICGKLFKLEDRFHVLESHEMRIDEIQSIYVKHCFAHLKHTKKTRADWSDTQRILSLLQQPHIHAKWTELLHERNIDHETVPWKWQGGRTAEFITMLERGEMYSGRTYEVDALSLVTLLEAGQPCSAANDTAPKPQNTIPSIDLDSQHRFRETALSRNHSGSPADHPGMSNDNSLELSRVVSGRSSAAYDRMDGLTLVGSRGISPVITATRVSAGTVHPLMLDDPMYVSEDGFSPGLGSPDFGTIRQDASPIPERMHDVSHAYAGDLQAADLRSDARCDQVMAHLEAGRPGRINPHTQPAQAQPRQSMTPARATHALHPQPVQRHDEHNRKKRPVSFTNQIKRKSRDITCAIFSARRNPNDVLPKHI